MNTTVNTRDPLGINHYRSNDAENNNVKKDMPKGYEHVVTNADKINEIKINEANEDITAQSENIEKTVNNNKRRFGKYAKEIKDSLSKIVDKAKDSNNRYKEMLEKRDKEIEKLKSGGRKKKRKTKKKRRRRKSTKKKRRKRTKRRRRR